jgi:hypothetical protein
VAVEPQMRWIRRKRRIGAWAALFALALQITLSFGHVHLDKLTSSASLAGSLLKQTASQDNAPGSPNRHTGANDFCAICATISLIASSALPQPACLAPPVVTASARPHEFDGTIPSSQSHFPFQARAPPVVA